MYVILLSTERTRIDVIKLSVYRDYIIVSIPPCQKTLISDQMIFNSH